MSPEQPENPPGDPHRQYRIVEVLKAFARGWIMTLLVGKRPALKNWSKLPPPSPETAEQWATQGNIGLRTGGVSGVVVVDDDTPDQCAQNLLKLPQTITAITGSGNLHFYFASPPQGLRTSHGGLGERIDLQADGAQVVFPGSIHPRTGHYYTWAPGLSPDEVALAPFPEHLLARLREHEKPKAQSTTATGAQPHSANAATTTSNLRPLELYAHHLVDRVCGSIREASEGTRNQELNKQSFLIGRYVGAGLLDPAVVHARLREAALVAGLGSAEIEATLRSGLGSGMAQPIPRTEAVSWAWRYYRQGDIGNAQRMADIHGYDIRYCSAWGKFLIWDGRRWVADARESVMARARDVSQSLRLAAEREEAKDDDSYLKTLARHCESVKGLNASTQIRAGHRYWR